MQCTTLGVIWLSLVSVGCVVTPLHAGQFHVTTHATADGNGSRTRPWQLQIALGHPPAVLPGDTIWLHGGRYTGSFVSFLRGTAPKPIIVRVFPGEHAVIDGGTVNKDILRVAGTHAWFWGFEIMSSSGNRVSAEDSDWPSDVLQNTAVAGIQEDSSATGCKFINLVVHDAAQGFSLWKEAMNAEIYGCLIYYNGWVPPNKPGAGHGIYTQNSTGVRKIADNILWANFSHGIHAYGSENSFLNNIVLVGNVVFSHSQERNLLLGGGTVAQNPVVQENYTYDRLKSVSLDLGYGGRWGKGTSNAVVKNNYFVGRFKMHSAVNAVMSGNVLYGYCEGFSRSQYPDNTYVLGLWGSALRPLSNPGENFIAVRPNLYEKGRANIVVYNWAGAAEVGVLVDGVLRKGDKYVVKDAQNYFGDPVAAGTYNGGPVRIPMTSTSVAPKVGNDPREILHTDREFGAFILQVAAP